MKALSDNQDLYEYLIDLKSKLKIRGSAALAKAVDFASRQRSGMSTEFLGESRVALRKVLEQGAGIITPEERAELSDILKQLNKALDDRRSNTAPIRSNADVGKT